jgi:hypothetical protein
MFGWLKDRFTNAGKLEKAARNATKAANKYGTANSRSAAKADAVALEATAETTKKALDMAQKNLKDIQDKCTSEISVARKSIEAAQASHNKVKDTTFQKIKRFATLGPAAWGSRSAAVNIAQKRMENAATKKREQLRALATKQKDAMDAEELAIKRRKAIIASALGTANSAANAAKQSTLTNVANFKPPVSNAAAAKINAFLKNNNSKSGNSTPNSGTSTPNPENPTGGGRRRGRGTRKPRRR